MKYLYRFFLILLLSNFSYSQEGNVGIDIVKNSNGELIPPQATLDVNGTVYLKDIPPFKEGNYDVVIDTLSGELQGGFSKKRALLGNLRYRINCTDAQDWVEEFNTNIPTDEYFVAITNSNFIYSKYKDLIKKGEPMDKLSDEDKKKKFYGISHQIDDAAGGSPDMNPVKQVIARKVDGTWRLTADYRLADPYATGQEHSIHGYKYYWEIDLFVIHKSLVRDFIDDKYIIKGKVTEENKFSGKADTNQYVLKVIRGELDKNTPTE